MRRQLRGAWDELVDAVYPPHCPLCRVGTLAPGPCAEHALPPRPDGPRCARCAARLADCLADGMRCATCRVDPPAFGVARTLGDYRSDAPLREWVLALKHGGRRDLARELGLELGRELERALGDERGDEVLVPVPLHPWRRLERGYDQAYHLAREAALASGYPLVRALGRVRSTLPQGAPGAVSRRANVRGAFRVRKRWSARLAGRRVWLVDDVLTTGATASECARELKRAGASEVGVLCVARAG